MNEKDFVTDITPCIFCGSTPYCFHYGSNMYYIICSNPECKIHNKFGTYNFLGATKKLAVEQWEFANRPLNRVGQVTKKKKNGKSRNLQSTNA